jgi:two-component system phosphate regulon sensor histidine kinase PhoR
MQRRRLFWQIFPALFSVTLVVLLVVSGLATSMLTGTYEDDLADDLTARLRLIEPRVLESLAAAEPHEVDRLVKTLGRSSNTRFTVIARDGRVLGDTDQDPARMESHAGRPEVVEAFRDGAGSARRVSATLGDELFYVAITPRGGDLPRAALRAAVPMTAVHRRVAGVRMRLFWIGGLIVLASAAYSLWISRRLSLPLERMRRTADRFAQGDLDARLPATQTEEIAGLADAMKNMALQLNQRIRAEARQLNEQQAVLSSMVEGVLAIDTGERILNINAAAARLIGIDDIPVHGRAIQEVVRNVDLQRFIQRALTSREPVEGDIVVFGDNQRFLRANGTVLHDAEGRSIGTVIVLHDMTRLRHLEHLRREFVANVSHELRTPITSIKGFAETLLENCGGDDETERFLRIIARQADRLNAIIEDLLSLARIEEDADHGEIVRAPGSVREVLMSAIQICAHKADAKQVRLVLDCDAPIGAEINAPLIEQAVVNLIDNAVKYSDPGATVRVAGSADAEVLRIQVVDNGCGIESRHLPRLFERFYRVDRARSRKLGGTGLGLAIVKHIVEAHGGQVTVTSEPGKGSTFTLTLPAPG